MENPSISDEIPNDFSIYENNFLKIDYPSSWELTETNYSIIFFPENDNSNIIK